MKRQYLFIRNADATDNTGGDVQPGAETPVVPETPAPVGQADEAQLKDWKQKHPQGIYGIAIPRDDGQTGMLYFCKPNRNHLNYSKTKRSQSAHDEQFLALAEVTFLGGDETLLKDEQAMITVSFYMENMDIGKAAAILNL